MKADREKFHIALANLRRNCRLADIEDMKIVADGVSSLIVELSSAKRDIAMLRAGRQQ